MRDAVTKIATAEGRAALVEAYGARFENVDSGDAELVSSQN